jgi:hypothetical protein
MSLNVQYGPVSAAIGLAQQAGAGIRKRQQQQSDQDFLQYVQQAQDSANRNSANEISSALQQQSIQAENDRAAAEFNRQSQNDVVRQQMEQANLNLRTQQESNDQAALKVAQQQRQSGVDLAGQKYTDRTDAISQLPAAAQPYATAGVHQPGATPDEQRLLIAEYRRTQQALATAQKDLKAAEYDPNDMRQMLAEPSTANPKAKKGLEDQYAFASQRTTQLQERIKQLDDALSTRTGSVLQPGAQVGVAPAAAQAIIQNQQSAPAQQSRILATERNPQDGKMWGYDANQGRWIPLE